MHNDKLGLNLLYVLIDFMIGSSLGNETLTCLMWDSSDDHNNYCFIELCF